MDASEGYGEISVTFLDSTAAVSESFSTGVTSGTKEATHLAKVITTTELTFVMHPIRHGILFGKF